MSIDQASALTSMSFILLKTMKNRAALWAALFFWLFDYLYLRKWEYEKQFF
jgi:hypothetical protein